MNERTSEPPSDELKQAYGRIQEALRLIEDGAEISERLPATLQPRLAEQIEALDLAGRRLLERVDAETGKPDPEDVELVRERSHNLLRAAQNAHREAEFLDDGPAVTSINAIADTASEAVDRIRGKSDDEQS